MDHLVDRTIRGDFGNGEERKRRLGPYMDLFKMELIEN